MGIDQGLAGHAAAEVPSETDRILFRIAGIAGVALIFFAIPAQLLHPLPDADSATSFLEEVTKASSYWTLIHFFSLIGYSLAFVVFVALYRSVSVPAARAVAALALGFGVIGVAFSFSWFAIDGAAIVNISEAWESAPAADLDTAFRVANAIEEIILAYFSMIWVVFFGLPLVLFGTAVALDQPQRAWLGWLGVGAGLAAIAIGVTQVYTGRDFLVTDVLIPIAGFASGFWIIAMGILLGRRARALGRAQ
jgi:hypothetical protein